MQGVTLQQMMQVKVPAGIRPGMGFMVASPEGTQFQVQCPPGASEGMLISVAPPQPAVQPIMPVQPAMPVQPSSQVDMQQIELSNDPNAPLIPTEEIKICYCHTCPAPPFIGYNVGCVGPKGASAPDVIESCWLESVCSFYPWWADCHGPLKREPGTNTFSGSDCCGDVKYHVSKNGAGKIKIRQESCCVWGNDTYEDCA